MQSDNYLDKNNDKTGYKAMKYSESHALLKISGDVFIKNSQVIWFDQKCIIILAIFGLTLLHIQI